MFAPFGVRWGGWKMGWGNLQAHSLAYLHIWWLGLAVTRNPSVGSGVPHIVADFQGQV